MKMDGNKYKGYVNKIWVRRWPLIELNEKKKIHVADPKFYGKGFTSVVFFLT